MAIGIDGDSYELDLGQGDLADIIRTHRTTLARWETKPREAITSAPADRLLRLVYEAYDSDDGNVRELLDTLRDLDDARQGAAEFEATPEGWPQAAGADAHG